MNSITITKPELQAALAAWEQANRDGKCISVAEAAAMPVDQVAAESTEDLWQSLVDAQTVEA